MQKQKTHVNVACISYGKFNILITDPHKSIEENKQILKVVDGERNSIAYLSQKMNSDLVKLQVKSHVVIDTDIQN